MDNCIFCGANESDTVPIRIGGLKNVQLKPVCDKCIAHLSGWEIGFVTMPGRTHKAKILSGETSH